MTYLLDVNASIDPGHVAHDDAHAWFSSIGDAEWATCPIAENGVTRIAGRLSYCDQPKRLELRRGMTSLVLSPPDPGIAAVAWRLPLRGAGSGFFQSPDQRARMGGIRQERSGGIRLIEQSIGATPVALRPTGGYDTGPEVALWSGNGFAAIGGIVSLPQLLSKPAPRAA